MNSSEAEDGESAKMEERRREALVYMCGYLPGASPEKSPVLSFAPVQLSQPADGGDSWKEVCGGGCGFAMAISGRGKLITWGSADEEGQSYVVSGKHGEAAEALALPTEASLLKAAAGWAHCVSVTEHGEVYTWGWKECVPSGKLVRDLVVVGNVQMDEQASHLDGKRAGEDIAKRRKISSPKVESESSLGAEEFFSLSPCLVTLGPGVRITTVAAGGRHTLALSDMGQVWGWGYGGEGQLGLGTRVKMVSSPHLISCIEPSSYGKDTSFVVSQGSNAPGSYVKEIACGGRHSVVVTDAGAMLTFGWGMYGQVNFPCVSGFCVCVVCSTLPIDYDTGNTFGSTLLVDYNAGSATGSKLNCGQGNTKDQLRPTYVNSLSNTRVKNIAAGLWHTLCMSADGGVHAFGGNQFGQLGTGIDEAVTIPRLLDSPSLENKQAKVVSCGARHSIILTEDGQLFSWGWNKYGQLGLGDAVDRSIPTQVSTDGCLPKNVACGWWHTLLLAEMPIQ